MFDDEKLLDQITHDEGRKPCVYKDSMGLWTIGDGILVDPSVPGAGLRTEEMDFIRANRVGIAADNACTLLGAATYTKLSDGRRRAVINMCYNLGYNRFARFHMFIAAAQHGDWQEAALQLEKSLWYKQVGSRALRIVQAIRSGVD